MCVIAVKPKDIDMPSDERIADMWKTNKDGAGYMYALDDNIYIEKGFMTLDELKTALRMLNEKLNVRNLTFKDIPMVMHFRITTHGGTSRENTHPFPLSTNVEHLRALDVVAKMGVAHNGVIYSMPVEKELSDTQIFIRDIAYPLSRLSKSFTTKYATLIKAVSSTSRFAFMNGSGIITLIGDFKETTDSDGLYYSNLNFVPYKYVAPVHKYESYDYSTNDYDEYYDFVDADKEELVVGAHYQFKSALNTVYDLPKYVYVGRSTIYTNFGEFRNTKTNKTTDLIPKFLSRVDKECDVNTKEAKKHQIGGAKNKETRNLNQSADRTLYDKMKVTNLPIIPIAKGSYLTTTEIAEYYEFLTITEDAYVVKVDSDNWFYCPHYNSFLYKQKDSTYIQISNRYIDTIIEVEYEGRGYTEVIIGSYTTEDLNSLAKSIDIFKPVGNTQTLETCHVYKIRKGVKYDL